MGGQLPNNLAIRLHRAGVRILGTSAESIDRAEDRHKFSALLDQLCIDQPPWQHVTHASDAERIVERLGGYPVLVRPSYVLSGAAMSVAREKNELLRILARAKAVSPEHPVVVSKFETHARELEIDAVADGGEIVLWAISEHVEDAGVHSGDATLVLPPQSLYIATIRQARKIAQALAKALRITGPFNVQYLAKLNTVKVIECNLRASRSFPFVSKVTAGMGLKLYATHGTAKALTTIGIACTELATRPQDGAMTGMDAIEQGLVDLVINIPIEYDELGRPDGYHIRRRAVDAGIPLITDLQRAQTIIEALRHRKVKDLAILSWDEYAARRPVALK